MWDLIPGMKLRHKLDDGQRWLFPTSRLVNGWKLFDEFGDEVNMADEQGVRVYYEPWIDEPVIPDGYERVQVHVITALEVGDVLESPNRLTLTNIDPKADSKCFMFKPAGGSDGFWFTGFATIGLLEAFDCWVLRKKEEPKEYEREIRRVSVIGLNGPSSINAVILPDNAPEGARVLITLLESKS